MSFKHGNVFYRSRDFNLSLEGQNLVQSTAKITFRHTNHSFDSRIDSESHGNQSRQGIREHNSFIFNCLTVFPLQCEELKFLLLELRDLFLGRISVKRSTAISCGVKNQVCRETRMRRIKAELGCPKVRSETVTALRTRRVAGQAPVERKKPHNSVVLISMIRNPTGSTSFLNILDLLTKSHWYYRIFNLGQARFCSQYLQV